MVPPKISLLKLTQGQTIKELYEKYQVIQDMLVPLSDLGESLQVFDKELKVRLLFWHTYDLCNIKPGDMGGM